MPSLRSLRGSVLPPEVSEALPRLLKGEVPGGVVVLREGFVYRVGQAVVKLFPRSPRALARLRPSRAQRAVRAWRRLQPVRSPRPLHWNRLKHARFESLLVYEYVEGQTLRSLWKQGVPEPLAALPQLFADLHRLGVLHADLHGENMIWSNKGWCLLDLDGVRHGLHLLRRRIITENTWARLLLDLEGDGGARSLYAEFLGLAGQPWACEPSWQRILVGYERVLRIRGLPIPQASDRPGPRV